MTQQAEQVLVIPRSQFIEHEPFVGFRSIDGRSDLGDYLQGAPVRVASFMNRSEAENNPFFLQIIPYIVIMSEDKVFLYRRGEIGSEARLHGKYSIGIGGHINPEDDEKQEPFYAFLNGAVRELREEVGVDVTIEALQGSAVGLVNDDSNDVGRVHLGVVLVIKVSAATAQDMLKTCENTMLEPQWIPLYELENPQLSSQFETWSGFVAHHLIDDACKDAKWDDKAFRERVAMLSISAANLSSSATSFLIQESPRGHMISKAMVETGAGEVQCMLAGLIGNDDIEGHEVKKAAKEFHETLGQIVKHQKITIKDITLKSE
jgi:predicted NUDIX family phosphoesterase